MTEEEIRIIVDRVFTELRNNSKTIAQLSEKTEVDNCWFEIDNGFKISLSTLKKYIVGTESINISDLSDLDNYKLTTHRGVFNVYRGNILVGVLFIIQYQAAHHGGLQIFMSTFDYKMSGTSSLSMPSIIYRSTDYNNIQVWGEWKPYQNTFISNDGSVTTNSGLGFNETNFAPSLSLFFKKLAYPEVVEWSGTVTDVDFTPEMSSPFIDDASLIYFSTVKKSFYVLKDGKYYNSWGGELALYLFKDPSDMKLTKNIFKGLDESVWIAVSEDSIQRIDIKNAGTITIDKELNENSTNPVQNAVITKGIEAANEFYPIPGDITTLIQGESEEAIGKVREVIGTIDGWTLNGIKKKYLIDKNGLTASFYSSSVGSGNYQYYISYYNGILVNVELFARQISTSGPPTLDVERVTINKSSSVCNIENGDIVLPDKSTMTLESYKASGRSDAIGVVFDSRKGLFVRKNKYTGVLIGNQDRATNIFYNVVRCKDPYDGKVTQKMNLLNSLYWSSDFPVFSYAEENGLYVASNGELAQMHTLTDSLDAIGSDYGGMANIASCTQVPLVTTRVSVFYGGAWEDRDTRDPLTSLSYFLIDIL